MNVLPVITRELRAQARQPFTYFMRVLGVVALLAAGAVFALGHSFISKDGGKLFAYLHTTLLGAIWILIPLSTADCISRERREGTLGLLFLTPLKPADIIIAKSLAHGLRAATLLVAILPVLTIPILLGGVSWETALLSALVNFNSICWALAAAILGSAWCRRGLRALVVAVCLAVLALVAFAFFTGLSVKPVAGRFGLISRLDYLILLGGAVVGFASEHWGQIRTMFLPAQLLRGVAVSSVYALLALTGAVLIAAWRIRHVWHEEPPPIWVQRWQKKISTPVMWVGFFRRWMRWKLQRNPIGWLEQRTWQGRLVTWSWFAVVISIYSAVLTDPFYFRDSHGLQLVLCWLLMGSIASSAAGSFRRERESGVLELLLVAPLTGAQIIGGRLRGLWGQFLPAVGMLLGVWFYFTGIFKTWDDLNWIRYFGVMFVALPVIGLYFSLRCRSFLAAFIATLLSTFVVPWLLQLLFGYACATLAWLLNQPVPLFVHRVFDVSWFGGSVIHAAFALLFGKSLHRRLVKRAFPLERTAM